MTNDFRIFNINNRFIKHPDSMIPGLYRTFQNIFLNTAICRRERPVQHSRWVKPRWKKSSASVGNMPPRTSVDLKFVPAVQLLFLACSTVFLTSKGIPRWYFSRKFLSTRTPQWIKWYSLSNISSEIPVHMSSSVTFFRKFLSTWAPRWLQRYSLAQHDVLAGKLSILGGIWAAIFRHMGDGVAQHDVLAGKLSILGGF